MFTGIGKMNIDTKNSPSKAMDLLVAQIILDHYSEKDRGFIFNAFRIKNIISSLKENGHTYNGGGFTYPYVRASLLRLIKKGMIRKVSTVKGVFLYVR